MAESITDLTHAFASGDCRVYFFKSGNIIVESDLIKNGSYMTTCNKSARQTIQGILNRGAIIPAGVLDYLDK